MPIVCRNDWRGAEAGFTADSARRWHGFHLYFGNPPIYRARRKHRRRQRATQATHAIRVREIRCAGRPSKIRRMRCGRKLPGIAIPKTFTRTPVRSTARAISSRYSEYSNGSHPRASTAASQASSASAESRRSSHHASGWNQKTARFSSASHCTSGSRLRACSSSCVNTASSCACGHRGQHSGKITVGVSQPTVTGAEHEPLVSLPSRFTARRTSICARMVPTAKRASSTQTPRK